MRPWSRGFRSRWTCSTPRAASTAAVDLIVLDDSGEASRGATNTRRLLNQENVILMINASLWAKFGQLIADTPRAGVPLLFA